MADTATHPYLPFREAIARGFSSNPQSLTGSSSPGTPAGSGPSGTHPVGGPSPYGSPGSIRPGFDPTADPTYRQVSELYKAQSAAEKLSMEQAIARAKGYYGSESDPLSLFGRLKGGYDIRDVQIQNALNSRGMFRSGETGYGLNQSRLQYLRDQLDYKMKLEDYINGLLSGFAGNEQKRQLDLVDWAWRVAQSQAATGTNPFTGGGANPPVGPPTGPPGPQSGQGGTGGGSMVHSPFYDQLVEAYRTGHVGGRGVVAQ